MWIYATGLAIVAAVISPTIYASSPGVHEKPAAHAAAQPKPHEAAQTAAPALAPAHDDAHQSPTAAKEPAAASKEPAGHADAAGEMNAERAMQLLKQGNARFVAGKLNNPNTDIARRAETAAKGQKPFATLISCSDSRVPVELVFDRGIGELFVIRVAGNVCNNDEIGSAEYGVGHLGTPLVVVVGHTKCGAVTAVASGAELHGHIATLVATIKPAVEEARKAHPDLTGEAIVPQAIRANVFRSIEEILTGSDEIAEQVKSGKVRIEGALYDLAEGKVEWLGPHPHQQHLLEQAKYASAAGNHSSTTTQPSNAHATATPAASPVTPTVHAAVTAASHEQLSLTAVPQTQPASGEQVAGYKPLTPPGLLERCMAEESYRQGATHLKAGEYDQAAEKFETASRMDSTLIVARNDLAGVYYLQQRYDDALKLYSAILKTDPHYPYALRGAALCYASMKDYDHSRQMLESLLSLDRDDARTWLDLGDVHFLSGDRNAAQQRWQSAGQAKTADTRTAEQLALRLKPQPAKQTSDEHK
jgi:carbonic anhydrase